MRYGVTVRKGQLLIVIFEEVLQATAILTWIRVLQIQITETII